MTRALGAAVVLVVALVAGGAVGLLVPRPATVATPSSPMEQAAALLGEETLAAAQQALELLQPLPTTGPEALQVQTLKVLALTIRALELGGRAAEADAAALALAAVGDEDSPVRRATPVLLARHLAGLVHGKTDTTLEKDVLRALEERPEDAGLRAVAGRVAEDTGDDGAALDAWRSAHRLAPDNGAATLGLARSLARVGDLAEARRLLEVLLVERPFHTRALELGLMVDRADVTAAADWERRARTALDQGELPPTEKARLAMTLALVAYGRGDVPVFASLVERGSAVEADPNALQEVARMRLAMGDTEKAVALLEKAVAADEGDLELRKDWARAVAAAARGPEWLRTLKVEGRARGEFPLLRFPLGVIHAYPGTSRPWETVLHARLLPDAQLAAITAEGKDTPRVLQQRIRTVATVAAAGGLMARGQGREAKTRLRAALEENKKDLEVLVMLARVEANTGEAKEAERHLKEALALRSNDGRALLLQARMATDAGDAAGALKALRGVEAGDVDSPRAAALRARALLLKGGAMEAARKELVHATELDPGDPEAGVASAAVWLAENEESRALDALAPVAKSSPARLLAWARASSSVAPLLGKALHDNGSPEDGLALLREHTSEHPDDPAGFLYLGLVLQAVQDTPGAREALNRYWNLADPKDPRRPQAARAILAVGGKPVTLGKTETPKPAPQKGKRGR